MEKQKILILDEKIKDVFELIFPSRHKHFKNYEFDYRKDPLEYIVELVMDKKFYDAVVIGDNFQDERYSPEKYATAINELYNRYGKQVKIIGIGKGWRNKIYNDNGKPIPLRAHCNKFRNKELDFMLNKTQFAPKSVLTYLDSYFRERRH